MFLCRSQGLGTNLQIFYVPKDSKTVLVSLFFYGVIFSVLYWAPLTYTGSWCLHWLDQLGMVLPLLTIF